MTCHCFLVSENLSGKLLFFLISGNHWVMVVLRICGTSCCSKQQKQLRHFQKMVLFLYLTSYSILFACCVSSLKPFPPFPSLMLCRCHGLCSLGSIKFNIAQGGREGEMVPRRLKIKFYCVVSQHLCGSLDDPWLMMYMYIPLTCVIDNVSKL